MVKKTNVKVDPNSDGKQEGQEGEGTPPIEKVETSTNEGEGQTPPPKETPDDKNVEELIEKAVKDATQKVSQEYDKKIDDIKKQHALEIKSKDAQIHELIHGEGEEEEHKETSIIDRINEKRNHNKMW